MTPGERRVGANDRETGGVGDRGRGEGSADLREGEDREDREV